MTVSPGFIQAITDELATLGHISSRKMFGTAALYCDGQVFAVVDDDVLYLKVDDQSRAAFEAEGCGPFIYMTKDGPHSIAAYSRAPDRLLDDADDLRDWVRTAVAVGHRAAKSKPAAPVKRKSSR
jgi:DNA transformation protein and related proteins